MVSSFKSDLMKVLITGASGFVGTALTQKLIQKGYEVIGVSRNPMKQQDRQGLRWVTLGNAPETDAVIHLAGENVLGIWIESKKRRVYQSRIEGTRRLMETIHSWARKPTVLIGASAVGIYEDHGSEIIEENHGSDSEGGFLAQVCHDWESENRKAEKQGVRVVLTRIGLVMDPSDGMLGKQWRTMKCRVCLLPAKPADYLPWISLEDLVRLIIYSLENNQVQGAINATAPHPIQAQEWMDELDRYFKFWIKGFLPEFFLKPLGKEFCQVLYSSKRVVPRKLLDLGFEFSHSTWQKYLASLFPDS